ncbi:MAG: ABC transporter ATP-binding protein [Candidatus Eisenbacteria bacterium]
MSTDAEPRKIGHLEVRNLSMNLGGKPILQDVTIDFWPGHVHALIGPNGAGKSTLANTIMGLDGYREFEGDVLLDGESLRDVPIDERARRGITLGWQEPARFEGLRVREYILAGTRNGSDDKVRDALLRVGLDPERYATRAVDKTLSGGERKRIELASILAMRPRIVLMDEPDSGIDVDALNRIFEAIRELKSRGTTVILITHSLTVLKQAEHAFLFCHGKLIDKGPVDRIGRYFENQCIPCDHQDGRESLHPFPVRDP